MNLANAGVRPDRRISEIHSSVPDLGACPKINHMYFLIFKMLSCLYAVLILDVLLTKTIIQTESCKEAMMDRKLRPLDNPDRK